VRHSLFGTAALLAVLVTPPLAAQASGGVRVCAGGDVTLGTNLDAGWARRLEREPALQPDSLLAPLRPLLAGADVVLVNVEGAIGEGDAPSTCGPKSTNCYAFRQPASTATALARLGGARAKVVGNVANNHAMDAGVPGFRETVRLLRDAGVAVVGADTLATLVTTRSGEAVALLGFSTSAGPDPRDLAAVRRHVARAARRTPRVVVTMHMGAEGVRAQRTPNRTEIFLGSIDRGNSVAFARAAAEAGASFVVGHGPHVMRAGEWQGDALVLYSLGNLVTLGPFSNAEPINRGALACAVLGKDGKVKSAELIPTVQRRPGFVELDPTARSLELVQSLAVLDFPQTRVRVGPQGEITRTGAEIAVRPAPRAAPREPVLPPIPRPVPTVVRLAPPVVLHTVQPRR
jgi:poly-gamma-glutamate capsule biosynthesis protein CapA/YwtB (metallophosphatase superfamily)